MPRLLSLFDGTGSACVSFLRAGWACQRVDIDPTHGPTVCCDIRQWDYRDEPVPDVIFCATPCEQYSIARTRAKTPRNFELADELAAKGWEIIEYFAALNPRLQWFIENPSTSLLWKRPVADNFPHRIRLSYCQYGAFYQKNTTLATNSDFKPRQRCNPRTCAACVDGKHILTAQRGPSKINGQLRENDEVSLDQLHAYPSQLVGAIFECCARSQG